MDLRKESDMDDAHEPNGPSRASTSFQIFSPTSRLAENIQRVSIASPSNPADTDASLSGSNSMAHTLPPSTAVLQPRAECRSAWPNLTLDQMCSLQSIGLHFENYANSVLVAWLAVTLY
jgi:hypothetical protein